MYYDKSNIDNGQDNIKKTGKISTTLTAWENQRNNLVRQDLIRQIFYSFENYTSLNVFD